MGTMWKHLDVSLGENVFHLEHIPFVFVYINHFYHLYLEYL